MCVRPLGPSKERDQDRGVGGRGVLSSDILWGKGPVYLRYQGQGDRVWDRVVVTVRR